MKNEYNILIIDDSIGRQYLNDQNEYKIKVALEALLDHKAKVNILTHIGTSDYLTFLTEFVLNEKSWEEFYAKYEPEFAALDLIIIDTRFIKAPNNIGIWGDKLSNRLVELDFRNKDKIIGVSGYKIDGKHYWYQSFSDEILIRKICDMLKINQKPTSTPPSQPGTASPPPKPDHSLSRPVFLRVKEFISKYRPMVFETFILFVTLIFFWVFFKVSVYTIGRVKNICEDHEHSYNDSTEFETYDIQIKNAITVLYRADSLNALKTQDTLPASKNGLDMHQEIKAKELIAALKGMHKVRSSNTTTKEFEIIESLFLLFIPLFVILGYFVYFQKSLSKYLLGGEPGDEVDESTKKSIELTKKLFLTSIFSFTILKLLDVFINDISTLPYYTIPINIILKVSILSIVLILIIWYNYSGKSSNH